jgi:hypothetical protein
MNIDWFAIATLVAISVGPILAVIVTRVIDNRRIRHERRLSVFRSLMRNRRDQLSADFVGALNLIEIEFATEPAVIDAWKALLKDFVNPWPSTPKDQEFRAENRNTLIVNLIAAIAKSLKIHIEQLDILKGGYVPQGWQWDAEDQRQLRNLVAEILEGKRGLPVQAFVAPPKP